MKRLLFLILAMTVAVLLAGCGNGDADPTPTPATATAPGAAAPAEGATATAVSDSPAATPADAADPAPTALLTATVPVTASAAPTIPSAEAGVAMTPTLTAVACAVEPNPDLVGYDGLVEKIGCPIEEASFDAVAINEFGTGPDYARFMLWFGSERQIYVLFPDKSWLAYTDTWDDSQPEIVCNPDNLDPATSPPLPRRGFGKLWCSVESVRTALGTIDREERLCQHSVTQRFERGRLIACFEDATIRYFRILDDGAWDMTMVQ